MLTVTQQFKDALQAPVKRVSGYIALQDGTQFLPSGDLQKFTIDSVGGFLRTGMSKISITMLGEKKLVDSVVDAYYGVDVNGTTEYVLKGKFTITDAAYKKDTDTTELTGYDNMIHFQSPYTTVGLFPTTLFDYLQSVCSIAGVVLENTTIFNGSLSIEEDYYKSLSDYTVRDVLEDICEASASYAIINTEGHVELRQIAAPQEQITYDHMKKYELGEYWGGINSLVLSRQPQNDDVYYRDDVDINSPTTNNVLDLSKFTVGYKTGDQ